MPTVGTPSLDQLQVLIAVVDEGSFAAAGRKLNRATSAISYSIASLETHLGLELFDRTNARRPKLTNGGETCPATGAVRRPREWTTSKPGWPVSEQGLEADLTLVVDVMLPTERLVEAVQAFEARFPTVTLRLSLEALSAVSLVVQRGVARLGVGGMMHTDDAGLELISGGQVEMIPVAAAFASPRWSGRRCCRRCATAPATDFDGQGGISAGSRRSRLRFGDLAVVRFRGQNAHCCWPG